nr:MAG TPA: hypothetical protein [Caudoviricetes sp.]
MYTLHKYSLLTLKTHRCFSASSLLFAYKKVKMTR